jgi:Gram-negative bacterial TonB protein C-terminal
MRGKDWPSRGLAVQAFSLRAFSSTDVLSQGASLTRDAVPPVGLDRVPRLYQLHGVAGEGRNAYHSGLRYSWRAMILRLLVRPIVRISLLSLLCVPCFAQDGATSAVAVEVPEKAMAERLSHFVKLEPPQETPGKCSSTLLRLKITVDEKGAVSDEEFVDGPSELRDSALAAIKQWTYKPYKLNGKLIDVHTQVSVFYLGDGESFPLYSRVGQGGNRIPLPKGCGAGAKH